VRAPARERYRHLERVQSLISQGDFDGALRESQEALARSPKSPPGDEALFDMALINAHSGNPKKDYKRSLGFFTRLVREFPDSPLVDEAKIWIGVLETIEKTKQVDIEIEEKKKEIAK
jgi:TolA-binding protein